MTNSSPDPQQEYQSRLAARRASAAAQAALFRKIGAARLVAMVVGALVFWRAVAADSALAWWLIPVALVSVWLLAWHQRVARTKRRCERAAEFYERGIARLEGRWAGTGQTGERFRDAAHPYAEDLDIFGRGSLFELICTARTRAGEEALAGWLLAPAAPAVIRKRQQAVEELRRRLDLREDFALLGEDLRAGITPDALAAWGASLPVLTSRAARLTAAALALLSAISIGIWFSDSPLGMRPFLFVMLIIGAFALRLRPQVMRVVNELEQPSHDLELLSQVLARLEQERFTSPLLAELRSALDADGLAPSKQIARLRRLNDWLEARRNQFFRPLSAPFLWVTQFAFAVEAWRARSGPQVARWIAAVGEIEALCALAGYAFERPRDPFPEIADGVVDGGALFDGRQLGHPLIPESRVVRTDLRLDRELRLLIVSGSNMSGKSTLLRTVGTNAALALAGAPVRAEALRISPLAVGASIRIQDSLQAGSSLFYAEITRLKQLVEMTKGTLPLLFVIDEILHGTNSHDRRIGTAAVIRGLVERGAIGLVTTHDLAITKIADDLAPHAANVHFEDHLEDGRMTFDYVLRPGVVQKSNALELMRSVGLDV
jgi:hypothetical protein